MENWEGPGRIECKDLGPHKCIITLESIEFKDVALKSPLLTSLFDEIKPSWKFTCCRSRRVWVELTCLPIQVWSLETFQRIAQSLGKLAKQFDLNEGACSFSTARIWVKIYQSEPIQEWLDIKVEGSIFEIFAKEFGRDLYSSQVHNN
ncbi:hypothetical protein PIB30_099966 [Stylosanthes scabra]|uniref:DUF4283 domain-containing protein n=1 Tax=Stylosanthes scabra TaxID=79078 RepID=A0ABU6UWL7_9FABA|nr:hypothetical protein [Stylosanthes scabra]